MTTCILSFTVFSPQCGHPIDITTPGTFGYPTDSFSPESYPNNANCSWRIQVEPYQVRECSFEKCWGGGEKRGPIHVIPPNPVRNLHVLPIPPPPRQNQNTLYLRSEFIEHLYHMSHNAMTSVMYFKQFGRTTLF